jgi:hypothetical protein
LAHRSETGQEWKRTFRFDSDQRAVTVTRELLARRDPEGHDFLEFVVTKSLEEHPESDKVQLLNLLLLRFVNTRWDEAASLERNMRLSLRSLPTDFQYTLHVVERKSTQDAAGSTKMGSRGGQVSALSLMEFELGVDKARKAHKTCLTSMRTFWKLARKHRNLSDPTHAASHLQDLLEVLEKHERSLYSAKREYGMLLEKYFLDHCVSVAMDVYDAEHALCAMRRLCSCLEQLSGTIAMSYFRRT